MDSCVSAPRGRVFAGLALCLLSFALAGCGSDDGDGAPKPEAEGAKPEVGGFGGNVVGDDTFAVLLVVLEPAGDRVDSVEVLCAPEGTLSLGAQVTAGSNVAVTDGKFTAKSSDVAIDGTFVSPRRAEGTIRGLSESASQCGVPPTGRWTADCNKRVAKMGGGVSIESGGCGRLER
jgi:hypothetical protein